ncbi:uncharacterized protein LOC128263158 isoform X1 [Drosophila gunungcola]|uniref:VWA7 Ig-like domain-containing protein n=1 Tax=Drosophila gunungcola TaxID=103775 RepID=A0A9P9YUB1_9MUSC|nr:uncharacterized protein LOC128263158 isoform X1 [Drosophila gunungcola]XP_052853861.1 uncharacterized protein LOC128263158 isoform X1 [Drosophila gunungcola]XP_052853862.1 uncharacterized protein LOC128263158 isoform X1 [Drosophila gunungcola]XP_052853863.1 uncharacterized protein LOC128263158 isoform X1 [Drosophila gunungcola]KAI8042839.1 hypothetical protein M5D96_004162 [Drosophila gunungcola]
MILRTQLWLGVLLVALHLSPTVSGLDEDYGGEMVGSALGGNDEIYDPAQLDAEVESEMQQHRNSLDEDQTESSHTIELEMSTMRPMEGRMNTMAPYSEENTDAELMEDAPTQERVTKVDKPSRDYYYEDAAEDAMVASTTARVVTTMIPEYVRQAKAERYPQRDQEHNSSDEEEATKSVDEEQVEQHEPIPQAQIQQLPSQDKPNSFKYSAEEDYYDEPAEVKSPPTTTTTPLPILRARFGGFPWATTQAAPKPPAASPTTSTTSTTTTTTTTTTSTTTPSPRKQPKQIQVSGGSKPELLPADQLRNYIKDVYIRMPLAVIVDPSSASLEQAKRLYIDALQDKNIDIKIVLVTLNGAGAPSAFSFNNTREFIAGLNSTKEHEGGNSFVGVLHAAELVPYDSAVFISTAAIPPHTELVQDAAITLLKKRIRLFLLWYGERSGSENETEDAVGGILGEVAIRSGGEIIHIVSTEHGQHIAGNTLTLVADAYQGVQELDLPVDTTLSSLHVRIDANMRRASMETPNGEINLKKLAKFVGVNATETSNPQELDAYVPLNKLRRAAIFKLKLQPELNEKYNVFVRAERKADVFLGDIIKRIDSYYKSGQTKAKSAKIQFPDKEKDTEKLEEDVDSPKNEIETFSEKEIQRTPNLNQTLLGATTGQPRSTLNAMLLQRCGTKIELGTQSQLLVTAGQTASLLFEVTNMKSEAVYSTIQVTDERRFLVQLNPTRLNLRALETATVRLTVLVPTGTVQGTTDRITFTNYGRETSTLAVNLKVVSSIDAQDSTGPTLSWEFGSRCDYLTPESLNCGERFWTLDVTAQDWQSGMLRLQATPPEGLFYRNYFTAGSTEPLKATYMASCCEPKVSLVAFDAAGNQRSLTIDVRDVYLNEAAIAAICLGVILLILLIAALIWSIVWCCRRRKTTLELPTYRSHSTRSME